MPQPASSSPSMVSSSSPAAECSSEISSAASSAAKQWVRLDPVTPTGVGLGEATAEEATVDEAAMDEGDLAEAAANAAQVLRIDLSEPSCFEHATAALHAGERVLVYLAAAGRSSTSEATLWEELIRSSEGPYGIEGGEGISSSSTAGSHAEAVAAAVCLRDLLRLSICTDSDLRLVRRVVDESRAFFDALRTAAQERSVPPSELWNALDALER